MLTINMPSFFGAPGSFNVSGENEDTIFNNFLKSFETKQGFGSVPDLKELYLKLTPQTDLSRKVHRAICLCDNKGKPIDLLFPEEWIKFLDKKAQ